ncbi:MAG: enoyl-CoA hydratase/isomerase family protein [Microthrixaceae bacterium]
MSSASEGEEGVHVTTSGPVATIWLNRPAKRNAMTLAMWSELSQHAKALGDDPLVRVVVVRGKGEHFCSGADISGLGEVSPEEYREANLSAESALAELPKPTVAFIAGSCVGGGAEIAVACDLRIAEVGARFGVTPARLGIVYPPPAVERLVKLVGPSTTKHLLYSAELIDAERALRTGLVDEIHEPADAERRLDELVSLLGEKRSLLTQMAAKEMVDAVSEHGSIEKVIGDRWSAEMEASGDPVEGVVAFIKRRDPRFGWDGPENRT